MRTVALEAIARHCRYKRWTLHAADVRSNHAHVVVTAPGRDPSLVRDQLKATATDHLRRRFSVWVDRPVWTRKGDIEFLDDEAEVESTSIYVGYAQDRKGRDTA